MHGVRIPRSTTLSSRRRASEGGHKTNSSGQGSVQRCMFHHARRCREDWVPHGTRQGLVGDTQGWIVTTMPPHLICVLISLSLWTDLDKGVGDEAVPFHCSFHHHTVAFTITRYGLPFFSLFLLFFFLFLAKWLGNDLLRVPQDI